MVGILLGWENGIEIGIEEGWLEVDGCVVGKRKVEKVVSQKTVMSID